LQRIADIEIEAVNAQGLMLYTRKGTFSIMPQGAIAAVRRFVFSR